MNDPTAVTRPVGASDPGSLQNLNDLILPVAIPWWPPAPGWYVLAALALTALAWLALRASRKWRQNRYRRAALRELNRIRTGIKPAGALPELLKRTALSAWPRADVASLCGEDWHRFLDESANMKRFRSGQGAELERLAYAADTGHGLSQAQLGTLFDATECWLKQHRVGKG